MTRLSGPFQISQKETMRYPVVASNEMTLDMAKTLENGNDVRVSSLVI
jgi:hypothetical protein